MTDTEAITVSGDNDDKMPVVTHSRWSIVCFGQLVSFLYASSAALQATLQVKCNLSAPTFTTGLLYFCLSFHLIPLYWERTRQRRMMHKAVSNIVDDEKDGVVIAKENDASSYKHLFLGCIPLQGAPWAYFVMALLDLEAYYFSILAYRYTTLTSVTILGSLATPAAMMFSRILGGRRYTWLHLLGVTVCMTGAGFNIFQDYQADMNMDNSLGDDLVDLYPNKFGGDVIALIASILFGLNDVVCELAVKEFGGNREYLGMVGFFAAMLATVQACVLELDDIKAYFGLADEKQATCPLSTGSMLVFGFLAITIAGYHASTKFLEVSESAFFNLSILTENLWSVVFSVVVLQNLPQPLFYVALLLSISGVCIYEKAPTPIIESGGPLEDDDDLEMSKRKQRDYETVSTRDGDQTETSEDDDEDDLEMIRISVITE